VGNRKGATTAEAKQSLCPGRGGERGAAVRQGFVGTARQTARDGAATRRFGCAVSPRPVGGCGTTLVSHCGPATPPPPARPVTPAHFPAGHFWYLAYYFTCDRWASRRRLSGRPVELPPVLDLCGGRLMRSITRRVLASVALTGLAALALGPRLWADKPQVDEAALERARTTVKMLDDLHKGYVVNITATYVEGQDKAPAAKVAKKVFKHMEAKGAGRDEAVQRLPRRAEGGRAARRDRVRAAD